MDVSEDEGKAASKQLQQEFANKDVMFLSCDVTKREELVRKGSAQSYGACIDQT